MGKIKVKSERTRLTEAPIGGNIILYPYTHEFTKGR